MSSAHTVEADLVHQPGSRDAPGADDAPASIEPVDPDLARLPEWQLAQRIAASSSFSRSEFLPRFLLWIAHRHLSGRTHEINESRIGIEVFRRPESYNPSEDNVVRNYARILRRRIDQYYLGEGRGESLHLKVPRGGYVPVFELAGIAAPPPAPDPMAQPAGEPLPDPPAELPSRPGRFPAAFVQMAVAFMAGIAACLAVLLLLAGRRAPAVQRPAEVSPAHVVWAQMFQQNRDTLLAPGDSGLGIFQNLTHRTITLADYIGSGYVQPAPAPHQPDPGSLADLRSQRYTSVVDLDIVLALSRLPEYDASHTFVRYTRLLSTNDLKHSNVVLLGSVHSNPWVSLFAGQLNFRLTYLPEVNNSFVLNVHRDAGEQPLYRNESGPLGNITYGVIDFLPNLENNGHVLILQGLNMAGTQAAADVLLHSSAIAAALRRATLPDGTLQPFEILVRTETLGADAPRAEIVAMRIHSS